MNVNIEVERVRHQFTKEKLAAELGVTSRTYNNYVRGETSISWDILGGNESVYRLIAKLLSIVLGSGGDLYLDFITLIREGQAKDSA